MNNEDPDYVPDPPEGKQCAFCGKFKPLTDYHRRGKKSKYYHAYCKSCHSDPFKYERISCPNCGGRICFFAVDTNNNLIKQKSNIIAQLKKEVRRELKVNKKRKRTKQVDEDFNVKDII